MQKQISENNGTFNVDDFFVFLFTRAVSYHVISSSSHGKIKNSIHCKWCLAAEGAMCWCLGNIGLGWHTWGARQGHTCVESGHRMPGGARGASGGDQTPGGGSGWQLRPGEWRREGAEPGVCLVSGGHPWAKKWRQELWSVITWYLWWSLCIHIPHL